MEQRRKRSRRLRRYLGHWRASLYSPAVLLLDGYSKSVKADLSADEVKVLVSLQSHIVADLTALSHPSKSEDE